MIFRVFGVGVLFVLGCAAQQTAKTSHAVPVFATLGSQSPGRTLSLRVTCTTVSKAECAHLAKPVTVDVTDDIKKGSLWQPNFTPVPASGHDITINLDLALTAGMFVRVTYYEGKLMTDWEPVVPTPAQVVCCIFSPTRVRVLIPIRVPVSLQVKDKNGQLKLFRTIKSPSKDYWWDFPIEGRDVFGPDDVFAFSAEIDGQPKDLGKGTYPAPGGTNAGDDSNPAPAPMSVISAAPMAPATMTPAPAPGPTGDCGDPQIINPMPLPAGGNSLTVSFGCRPNPPALVLFRDNKAQAEPRDLSWQQVPGSTFQFTAVLTSPLRPYEALKVFQKGEIDADPPAVVTVDSMPATPLPAPPTTSWWVKMPGSCPSPTVGPIQAGDKALTVTFPNPAAAATICSPALFETKIFADNKLLVDPKTVVWVATGENPLTYKAQFSIPLQAYQRVKVLQFSPAQMSPDSAAQIVTPSSAPAPTPSVNLTQGGYCADPYIPNAPGTTDTISAVLGCMPVNPAKDLKLLVNNKPPDGAVAWSFTGTSPITFTAKLSSPLKAGDSVQVIQSGQRDPNASPAQVASGPPKAPETSLIQLVQEGATSVTGTAQGLDKVRIQVVDGKNLRQQVDAAVDSTTNSFTANLPNPLQADQQLQIYGLSKSGAPSETAAQIDVQPLALDWGRVRGYFTAGVILSNNNSQLNLTNANPFLGFNVDKAWFLPAPSFTQTGHARFDRFGFNTYFDARLTAIPTGTTGSSSGSTPTLSTGSTTGTTGSTTSSGSSASSTGNPSPNPTTLLGNNQAAALQVGAYIPFTVDSWDFNERHYSLFVAPIAKMGFYTLTNAGSTANQAAENANRSNSTFFPFYSYGLRVGHRRDYSTSDGRTDSNRAPEQLSYLDFSVGKWSNLEYLQPLNFTSAVNPTCSMPASDPTTAACDIRQRLFRYGFEGLLVIPNTPLILGLSANVAFQHPRGAPGSFYLSPPDDLRFLFGVRFDASKLTGVLSKIGGQ